jgi:GT2 family glycosyltransferase
MCDISVVIPSYARPRELSRCLEAVATLTPRPVEIIVVLRPNDEPSIRVAAERADRVRVVDVLSPGHLPPLAAALATCRGQVMAVLDDDAVPRSPWLQRIHQAFNDPGIVGVGGPYSEDTRRPSSNPRLEGMTTALRMRLLHDRTLYRAFAALPDPTRCKRAGLRRPVPTDLVLGGNMAFRRWVLERIGIDESLNRGAAINYEADLVLGAKRFGTVLFDPGLVVDHYPASRVGAPSRDAAERYRYDYTYNLHYVAGKHFATAESLIFETYMSLVGQRPSPGVLRRLLAGSTNVRDPLAALREEGRRAGRAAREAGASDAGEARKATG